LLDKLKFCLWQNFKTPGKQNTPSFNKIYYFLLKQRFRFRSWL